MSNTLKARTSRKPTEHKELLVFFPDDYSAVKMSRNKVLGTAQQLSELKANTWANVDVGESQAWKGLIIKTGKSRNELARCELAFLKFLDRHADNKENIPLSNFFEEWENIDSSDDENYCIELEVETKKEIKATKVKNGVKNLKPAEEPNDVQLEARITTESRNGRKGKTGAKTGTKRQKPSNSSVDIQNKQAKKLKRDEACAQATMSRKQSEDIFQHLENYVQQGSFDESEDELDQDLFIDDSERNVANADDCLPLSQSNQNHGESFLEKLQEMFATSTKAIHNRFDDLEKAIAKLNDRQQGTEKKLEELASKISGKAKLSRPPPVNVVVSHSSPHLNSGATGASVVCSTPQTSNVSADDGTPVRKPLRDSNNDPDLESMATEKTGYVGNRKFAVTASPESIKRAEELARRVPKALAFNLLNLLVDLKTQSESNITGQNGKKALDSNILAAIQSHLAMHFDWDREELEKNWKREPLNLRQRIADKCRNLNKTKKQL